MIFEEKCSKRQAEEYCHPYLIDQNCIFFSKVLRHSKEPRLGIGSLNLIDGLGGVALYVLGGDSASRSRFVMAMRWCWIWDGATSLD